MTIKRIKIADQQQVNKPIYLLATGAIECGDFKYTGRYKKDFKLFFLRICDLLSDKFENDEYDVSNYKYWNAINIYDEYMVAHWLESISAEQVKELANETEVKTMIEEIRQEFTRAVNLKWTRIFKKSDPNDPETPRQAWQIL